MEVKRLHKRVRALREVGLIAPPHELATCRPRQVRMLDVKREVHASGMMNDVIHAREILPSPPVTFPVYGLDGSWSGSRWLDGFGDRIGDDVRSVRLAHQSTETGP